MLKVRPQGVIGRLADTLMTPIMYVLQGTLKEVPQRTHRWNNHKLDEFELSRVDFSKTISFPGVTSRKRWFSFIPIFHMPVFGGWKKFVVLVPVDPHKTWHVGWLPDDDKAGVSLVPVTGWVRVLIGSDPVRFFGFNEHGLQVELVCLGEGHIGKADIYAKVPLL
jgi:hypothetical protein